MTNQISIYNFNQNQVRTHQINNEPYFCLIDCCRALEIKQSTDRTFAKGVEKIHTLTKGGMQELTFINEPNLYRLIFRSNKPQAQAFADWVYSEVLPSIRKTGTYTVPAQDVEVSAHTRRLPSKPREIVLSEKARSEIGGIVKRCCAVAIKEALSELSANLSKDNPQYSIFDDRFESIDDRDLHNAITAYGNIMKQRGLFAGVMQTKDYILSGQYAKDQKKWEKSYNSRK